MNTEHLLFGAAYYSEYLPYDRVEQDMEMMERAGMNVIRIGESTWSTLEPQEGVFDFSHLDHMLDAAGRHHISVIVGTPTYAIPTWLVKKYPDILAITNNGQEIYGHRQNMDITHPGYLKHAEIIIRAMMEHIKDVPHIIGFQLDNETKSYGTAGPRVQEMFVDYLKEQYPDINAFNHEFGLDYWSNRINRWEDFPDVRGTINQSLAAEFQKFQRLLVTRFLTWQSEIVREYKREDQFITQNFDFDWTSHSFGYQPEVDQYAAAKCMTVAGCDIYHPSQDHLTGAEITFCGNIARSLKKENYLVLETQAQGNLTWLPYPKQLRLQAYSHIANGSNSVMYWHWHSIHNAIESYWKGVLSHDFSENDTYREASVIGTEWKKIGSHLVNLKKKPLVALMLDNHSMSGMRLFSDQHSGTHSYNEVARWLGDSLYRLNIEYDMISSEERDFSSYTCLVVPALYSASEELLLALSDYVKCGGHLITTFRTGFSDECIKIYADTQPHILNKCLGLHYDRFTLPENVGITYLSNTNSKKLIGTAEKWMDLVSCDTAETLVSYEHPAWGSYSAVAKNSFGNGSTLYFATMFDPSILDVILLDYFKELPVFSNVLTENAPVFPIIRKCGQNDFGRELCYYFNYSAESHTVLHPTAGIQLLTGAPVAPGETLSIDPWDLLIIENRE